MGSGIRGVSNAFGNRQTINIIPGGPVDAHIKPVDVYSYVCVDDTTARQSSALVIIEYSALQPRKHVSARNII